MSFWLDRGDHLTIAVRLTPNGGRDRLEGVKTLADGRSVLAARVRAAPEDGRANEALCAMVAKALGLSKSRVAISSGHTQRLKTLRVEGANPDAVAGLGAGDAADRG